MQCSGSHESICYVAWAKQAASVCDGQPHLMFLKAVRKRRSGLLLFLVVNAHHNSHSKIIQSSWIDWSLKGMISHRHDLTWERAWSTFALSCAMVILVSAVKVSVGCLLLLLACNNFTPWHICGNVSCRLSVSFLMAGYDLVCKFCNTWRAVTLLTESHCWMQICRKFSVTPIHILNS